MNRKVVDLAILYNFHKGYMWFSQQILQKRLANFECQSVLVNRRYCQLTKLSTLFHSKLEMTSYLKVVSLKTTFLFVDFEVFR
jgi:hypothetical protein